METNFDELSILDMCADLKAKGERIIAQRNAANQNYQKEWDEFFARTGFGRALEEGGAL